MAERDSEVLFSDSDCEELQTRHHQIPLEKGRFNGRILVPMTSREEEDAGDISPRSDGKKQNALSIRKENIPPKCTATTPSRADVHSPSYSLSFSSGTCGSNQRRSTSKFSKNKADESSLCAMAPTSNLPKNAKEQFRGESNNVLHELQRTNQFLTELVHHVEKTEKRMEKVEMAINSSLSSGSSGSSSSCSKRKKTLHIPLQVKVNIMHLSMLAPTPPTRDKVGNFPSLEWQACPRVRDI